MPDISVRGYDGSSGGSVATGQNRVEPQPNFDNMTLEQIQAWEMAHSVAPDTGALPASAVIDPVSHEPVERAPDNRDMDQLAAEGVYLPEEVSDRMVAGERVYDEPEPNGPESPINAQYVEGQPFIHVQAYLQATGSIELILTVQEAEILYGQLAVALTRGLNGTQ